MINQKTVLVLGAGASVPYGYPTGKELKELICMKTLNTPTLQIYARLGYDSVLVQGFIDALSKSGTLSIDSFLEYRNEYIEIGKKAITRELMKLEKEGHLFQTDDWYQHLFRNMNCRFEDFEKNKLSIITFNYDRSLEQFLFISLKNRYGKTDDECREKLSFVPILHVYGKIGNLPWEKKGYTREYAETTDIDKLIKSSDGIRILHENNKGSDEIFNQAFSLLQQADNIYFLGFGYHQTNLERLKLNYLAPGHQNVLGTSYNMTGKEILKIQDKITEKRIKLNLNNVRYQKTLEFLRENVIFE